MHRCSLKKAGIRQTAGTPLNRAMTFTDRAATDRNLCTLSLYIIGLGTVRLLNVLTARQAFLDMHSVVYAWPQVSDRRFSGVQM